MGASKKQMPGCDETCKDFPREMPIKKVERGGKVVQKCSLGWPCSLEKVLQGHQGITELSLTFKGVSHLLGMGLCWYPHSRGCGSHHPVVSVGVVLGVWLQSRQRKNLKLCPKSVFNVYLFLRERDRAQVGEEEKENVKQAAGSELSSQSPTQGSNPQTARS